MWIPRRGIPGATLESLRGVLTSDGYASGRSTVLPDVLSRIRSIFKPRRHAFAIITSLRFPSGAMTTLNAMTKNGVFDPWDGADTECTAK